MQLLRRTFLCLATGAAALSAAPRFARAQAYPTRPIRLIVPYPPGGPTDVVARIVASSVAPLLGQSVVVENKLGGASGTVGGKYVASAEPDGYTLLLSITGSLTITPSLYKLDYDPLKAYAPVALVVQNPEILTINPAFPAHSLAEFVAYARSNPGKINLGSPGIGTLPHLLGELLQLVAKIKFTHVPYHGAGPANIDLLAGQVQAMFNNPSVVLAHIEAGRMRALGVTAERRIAQLPDLPTFAELGYPQLTTTEWIGVLAPAGTPDAIVQKLNDAINEALKTPAARDAMKRLGVEPSAITPAAFKALMVSETQKWAQVIKQAGIKAE